ncbi:MAG: hypothetical protein LBU03_06480 [Tannerellaceae bacterium]|nr:hypothetical protein [Tannerellaceae bacterium]
MKTLTTNNTTLSVATTIPLVTGLFVFGLILTAALDLDKLTFFQNHVFD